MNAFLRKTTSVNGNTISYLEKSGDGMPILFLHGWGGSAESFIPLWEQLQKEENIGKRPFLAIDFPGFGESPVPKEPWTVSQYAECVAQYLNALQYSSVDIVSHSFGGRVSIILLTQYKALFHQAFLLAPAGIRHEKDVRRIEHTASSIKRVFQLPLLKHIFPIVRTIGYRLIGGQDYLKVSGVMKTTFQLVTQEDLSGFLPTITQPIAIAFGKNDTYVPYTDGEYMKEQIPTAELTLFEDGRHGIHKTHVTQLTKLFSSFFTKSL